MNTAQISQAMQNPQAVILQYAMQGMIQQHPKEWQQCQQMFSGKNRDQQLTVLRELCNSKGIDLDSMAKQWGIAL